MKRLFSETAAVAATMFALSLPGLAIADHLPAPDGVDCSHDGEMISVEWNPVADAVKYSVSVLAFYAVDGEEGEEMQSVEFDFGTSDRTDGLEMSEPNLTIAISDLDIDVDGDEVVDSPVDAYVDVKALDPGKNKGRQNHPFSGDPCFLDLASDEV